MPCATLTQTGRRPSSAVPTPLFALDVQRGSTPGPIGPPWPETGPATVTFAALPASRDEFLRGRRAGCCRAAHAAAAPGDVVRSHHQAPLTRRLRLRGTYP